MSNKFEKQKNLTINDKSKQKAKKSLPSKSKDIK